jgi:hypothetical protein
VTAAGHVERTSSSYPPVPCGTLGGQTPVRSRATRFSRRSPAVASAPPGMGPNGGGRPNCVKLHSLQPLPLQVELPARASSAARRPLHCLAPLGNDRRHGGHPPSPPATARPSQPESGIGDYVVGISDMVVACGTGRTCRSLPGAGRNGAILKRPGTGIHAKPQRQGMDIRPRTTSPSFFVREDATLPLGLSSDAAAPAPGSGTVLDKARRHGGDSEKRLAGRPLRSRHGRTLAR